MGSRSKLQRISHRNHRWFTLAVKVALESATKITCKIARINEPLNTFLIMLSRLYYLLFCQLPAGSLVLNYTPA